MYLWKIEPLIDDLKNGNVSQKEQFKYALAFSILMLIVSDPLLAIGIQYSTMDAISSFSVLVVTIVGLLACYRTNANADNRDFLLRFFTLGLPITIRFVTILIPLALVVGALEVALDPNYDLEAESTVTSVYQVVFISLVELVFYLYFAAKFKLFSAVENV